jgi:ribulose-phosphate 3-epimerase
VSKVPAADPWLTASLLCADPLKLGADLAALEEARVDYLHIDMADGHFVPLLGIGIEEAKRVRQATTIPFDVHLLVANPEVWTPRVLDELSPSIVTFCAEATPHACRLAQMIRQHDVMAGVAVNPGTPLSILDYLLPAVDLVLIMTINPGIVGQTVIPGMIEKIADLRQLIARRNLDVRVAVDGNVSFETAPRMIQAGADFLVCGSRSVFDRDRGGIVAATAAFQKHLAETTSAAEPRAAQNDADRNNAIMDRFATNSRQIVAEIDAVLDQVAPTEVEQLVGNLLAARRVFIFAVGRVLLSLQCLGKRLNHLGIECQTVGAMDEQPIGPEDLLLIASGSGESKVPAEIARIAKTKGAKLALITSAIQSTIKALSDTVVHLPCPTKNEPTRGVKSIQLMSTVFDQALHVFGDALALLIEDRKSLSHEEVWRRHANLE